MSHFSNEAFCTHLYPLTLLNIVPEREDLSFWLQAILTYGQQELNQHVLPRSRKKAATKRTSLTMGIRQFRANPAKWPARPQTARLLHAWAGASLLPLGYGPHSSYRTRRREMKSRARGDDGTRHAASSRRMGLLPASRGYCVTASF